MAEARVETKFLASERVLKGPPYVLACSALWVEWLPVWGFDVDVHLQVLSSQFTSLQHAAFQ